MKTILQVAGHKSSGYMNQTHTASKSTWSVLTRVWDIEGVAGLWKGNGINGLRVAPVYALKFGFNDVFKNLLGSDLGPGHLMAAGTAAGLCQSLVTYPLETIRTRLTSGVALGLFYDGIWDCFRSTMRYEGTQALYKGLGPTLVTGAPYVGLQMTFFSMSSASFKESWMTANIDPLVQAAMCGAGSNIAAQCCTYPGDTVCRCMQMDGAIWKQGSSKPLMYRSAWHCTRTIVKAKGLSALYSGLQANLLRAVPSAAVQFAAFQAIVQYFSTR
ncbi:hypothetical protein OAM67_01385 [bacterium]|nr:hypothetical protein [bacterium]